MGFMSAALYGLSVVLVKVGMRRRPVDNGHFMSVLVNVLLLGVLMLFVSLPSWSWTGLLGFVMAGLMTTWIGRGTSFRAIRFIGPSKGSAIMVSIPLFSALIGWIFLGEGMTLVQAAGGVLIALGILVLIKSRQSEDAPVSESDGYEIVSAPAPDLVSSRRSRIRQSLKDDEFLHGVLLALTAAMFFGGGVVARKWSIAYFPSAIAGAFFGALTALAMIALNAAIRRNIGRLVQDNLRDIPVWFVACGATSTFAIVFQFRAFEHLPAWVVSSLLGTQVLWALLWARLLLRDDEPVGWALMVSIALVSSGVILVSLGL